MGHFLLCFSVLYMIWTNVILDISDLETLSSARPKLGQSFSGRLVLTKWPRLIRGRPRILVLPVWTRTGVTPAADVMNR
jgi:hypothetical protein